MERQEGRYLDLILWQSPLIIYSPVWIYEVIFSSLDSRSDFCKPVSSHHSTVICPSILKKNLGVATDPLLGITLSCTEILRLILQYLQTAIHLQLFIYSRLLRFLLFVSLGEIFAVCREVKYLYHCIQQLFLFVIYFNFVKSYLHSSYAFIFLYRFLGMSAEVLTWEINYFVFNYCVSLSLYYILPNIVLVYF